MAKEITEPYEAEAIQAFLTVLGTQLASSVEFPGRPDLQRPTNRQELLASWDQKMRWLVQTYPQHEDDLERLHFFLGHALEAVLFPDRQKTSDKPSN